MTVAKSVITYDKDLPEIHGRLPWVAPDSHLVKDSTAPTGWRVEPGRRESSLLIVPGIRKAVDEWRAGRNGEPYAGASPVSRRLFQYWFDEDHAVVGFNEPFRYHFCQREAIETLVWLCEVARPRDTEALIKKYAQKFKGTLFPGVEFHTTMHGTRQVRRYVPEIDQIRVQDLPAEEVMRYAFKMATGSGKTWVMAMAMVWSYFHKLQVSGSQLSTNFLVVAPNVIVYQRLEKEFKDGRIWELPLVPPEWRPFALKTILRGSPLEPDPSGNVFVTNVQQLYESRDDDWTPQNAVDALLGRKPAGGPRERSMLERVKDVRDLVVMNDEAHHVHDEDLEWNKSLLAVHRQLPHGLSLWLDFSATPKDQAGMYFPWTVCDYPLAQAVEDRIVKAPVMVTREDDPKVPAKDPEAITADNIAQKYGYWLNAAIERWRQHRSVYKKLGLKPVLFIMTEKNVYADALGKYLVKTREFGLSSDEVLVIHTDAKGEVKPSDLEAARTIARDIDQADNKVKVIVSVMMLREGWDVRNVTVVLGLRPFTAKAEILPEQVIGRGLRLMGGIGPDNVQTLEVLGTRNLLDVLRTQLESEGVGAITAKSDPPVPVIIEPVKERLAYDIAIPLTKPRLTHDLKKVSDLDVMTLDPIYDQHELEEKYRATLKLEFATTQTEIHRARLDANENLPEQELVGSIATKTIDVAKLTGRFAEVYPIVRAYVQKRCFGRSVDLSSAAVRTHLARLEIAEGIAAYLARRMSALAVVSREIEFERRGFKLSETRPFSWRRNLPPLTANRTVFNYVATYNPFERRFAQFLDSAKDVVRFASLGTTEQGSTGTQFRVDYLKPSGAIGFYHPDWVVVQRDSNGEVNWIIETKGRVWESTAAKDAAMNDWCERVAAETGSPWRFRRINQSAFDSGKWNRLGELVEQPWTLP